MWSSNSLAKNMAGTNKRVESDIEKWGGVEVGLLWSVVEIIADIFLEVVLTILWIRYF